MTHDFEALYGRWSMARNSVVEEIVRIRGLLSSGKITAESVKNFLETAHHHASVQSDEFYQAVQKFHEGDSSTLKIIGFLILDLNLIRADLFEFYERYFGDSQTVKMKSLRVGCIELIKTVSQRIALEDDQFPSLLNAAKRLVANK